MRKRLRTAGMLSLLMLPALTGCQATPSACCSVAPPPVAAPPAGRSVPASLPSQLPDLTVRMPAAHAAQACLAVARKLEQEGNLAAAKSQYLQVRQLDPANSEAGRRLAVLYDREGDFVQSEMEYRRAGHERPLDPDLFNDWGYSYYLQGSLDQAARYFQRAIELSPHHRQAWCNLALTLGQTGRLEEARECLQEAGLGKTDQLCTMAYIHWRVGFIEQAREDLLLACTHDQSCEKAWAMLSQLQGKGAGGLKAAGGPAAPLGFHQAGGGSLSRKTVSQASLAVEEGPAPEAVLLPETPNSPPSRPRVPTAASLAGQAPPPTIPPAESLPWTPGGHVETSPGRK